MEQFAEDWYSKRNWLTEGQITLQQAKGFTAYALKKLETDFTDPRSGDGRPRTLPL